MKIKIGTDPEYNFHPFFDKINETKWKVFEDDTFENIIDILSKLPDKSVEHFFISSYLEKISHKKLLDLFELLIDKLKNRGALSIHIQDLAWTAGQVVKFENGQLLTSYYVDFEGDTGLQSIIYGHQHGSCDIIKSGFTKTSLMDWLEGMGFTKISILEILNDKGAGVLLSKSQKK
jgi:hypothetical protein